MWAFRAIYGGVYWSLTICRTRRDGQRDRRSGPWPCGLWTPAGAHRALNTPSWHNCFQSPGWTTEQRAAFRAGLEFIARAGEE